MDKMNYGNEGARQSERANLPQMSDELIVEFIKETSRVLKPSAYLFLWIDKFILCEGKHLNWFKEVNVVPKPIMNLVDMITWDKESFGMGARSRRTNEFLLVYQKSPKTTKNWTDKGIPDTWEESIPNPRNKALHPHRKPSTLLKRLITATAKEKDFVLDPCAGSFSVMDAAISSNRNFIGCDISEKYGEVIPS
jgi:site-specific DNA-methyltransferase (adenine-specific)